MPSGLYGIVHSNRDDNAHWGKNCFNSSFPAATASYMLDNNIPAIYVRLDNVGGQLRVVSDEIPIREVFNSGDRRPEDLYFSFETIFQPYQQYAFDTIDGIDLVIKDTAGTFLAPMEVKLTTLPDSTTYSKPENEWGSEIVIRSATTSYCAMGMFDRVKDDARNVRLIFEGACSDIQSWDNDFEMTHKTPSLCDCIDNFQRRYYQRQKPILMQMLWKTRGKSPYLADNAFDIVVWSDYAFSRLFLDGSNSVSRSMSRPQRASARLARCLWELSKSGLIHITDIYRQMAFGNQTDKEFSKSGTIWRKYVSSDRVATPILSKDVVGNIIDLNSIEKLSPERRLDQTLYFTYINR